jgi:F0F1-type ATP synthase epsilon subunit
MPKPFQLDVVSPEATVWSGQATFVVAKTPEGELGIMADHEPLMGALATGPKERESKLFARLSPRTNTSPAGTSSSIAGRR